MSTWSPEQGEQILSTLNVDGTRHWLRPMPSSGRFVNARRAVGYALIAIFILIPLIKINGKPLILLDVTAREFSFFGFTFLPTDTLLLAIFMVGFIISIFFITALLGRIWCGWMCPQLVYMEFVYRPIEYFFDGKPGIRGVIGKKVNALRTLMKYLAYLVISLILAHIFLAYFVGVDRLSSWILQSPFDHPLSFFTVWLTTGLMMFNFCYFREQTCVLACPYGRFQSVMLDSDSLIISYDEQRGEPRGRLQRNIEPGEAEHGDCIDCNKCVETCPTGIDIRKGLQLECVACAQCIDACDAVMDKIKKPRGLIRYSSQSRMEGSQGNLVRPRVIIYPLILMILAGAFGFTLSGKEDAEVKLLRGRARPYIETSAGVIANQAHLRITNRTDEDAVYSASMLDDPSIELKFETDTLAVPAGESLVFGVSIVAPLSEFKDGRRDIQVSITDGEDYTGIATYRLMGPHRSRFPQPEPSNDDAN